MKNSFLSTERPPLSFYHRILRVLFGLAMLIVAVFQIFLIPASLFILAYWLNADSRNYAADNTFTGYAVLLYMTSHVLWIIAALMLIFKRLHPRSKWGTLCTIGGLATYNLLYYLFDNTSEDTFTILLTIVFTHFGLAVGAIFFSWKNIVGKKPPVRVFKHR